MFSPDSSDRSEQPLVQAVLEPLLDDFQYWFDEAEALLNSPDAACLDASERDEFAEELKVAKQEVSTAKTLMLATGGSAGVETDLVGRWHRLVSKYWQTARYVRQQAQQDD